MNLFSKSKNKSSLNKQSGRNPDNVTSPSSSTQPSSSASIKFIDKLQRQFVENSDQTPIKLSMPSTPSPHSKVSGATDDLSETATSSMQEPPAVNQSTQGIMRATPYPPETRHKLTVDTTTRHDSKTVLAGRDADASGPPNNAIGGIIAVLKAYDQITGNTKNLASTGMINQLALLEQTMLMPMDDENELKRCEKLQNALQRILTNLGDMSDPDKITDVNVNAQNKQVLAGCVHDIRDVLLDYRNYKVSPNMNPDSSQFQGQDSQPATFETNPRSGFFREAHVDAKYGVFNDVGRDQYNLKIEMKDNDLDKLPRAKGAGHRSGNHDKCLESTRRTELRRIENWETDRANRRVYWLNGTTGCGKSTIAKTFAERSFAKAQLGASFFCSRDFDDRRNIHLIFPTLAYHLSYRYTNFKAALLPIVRSNPDVGYESLDVQFELLLVKPLKLTGLSITIIIDALDECEDDHPASAILSLLGQHINKIPSVKFFITGRPEVPIRTGFRLPLLRPHTEVFLLHEVDQESVDQDIELYLRTHLSKIVSERSDCDLTIPWPSDEEIGIAVKKCSGLFVVASIIVKIVADHNYEPQEQLHFITSQPNLTVREGFSGIDETYNQVFIRGFGNVEIHDTAFFSRFRLVVGSIVLVFNPQSCADLEQILDIPRGRVRGAVRSLHSVLIIPDSDYHPFRICHKSFADFLTDPNRCKDTKFNIDPSNSHLKLGMCCLKLMNKVLKRNICDLPPYVMNKDVDDLGERREKYIGGGLEYACRWWARHLRFASRDGDDVGHVVESLKHFLEHYLLSWLEVLSIIGDIRRAVYSLRDVRDWLATVSLPDTNLSAIVKDGERFVLRFFDIIETSALHLYHSALSWSPATSLVRTLYQDQISTEAKLLNIDAPWDACIRIIRTRNDARCITFSRKDDLIAVGEEDRVEIFEVLTGYRRATLTRTKYPICLTFSPDDTLFATGCKGGTIDVWDLQTGGIIRSLEGHAGDVWSVAFSPCGAKIASCSNDHTIRIWNASSYDCQWILKGHSGRVWTLCWSATGHEIISGSTDRTIKVWDPVGMRCLRTFTGYTPGSSVACSPDSSFIASASDHRTVKILDARTGDVFQIIPTNGDISSVRFLNQDQIIYTTYDSAFVIWDLTKDANVLEFKYEGDRPAISSNGTFIASRDNASFASRGMDHFVKVWQTNSTTQIHDTAGQYSPVYCPTFSGDGRLVASGSTDGTIKLWNATTGLCLETLYGHFGRVYSITFSPDATLCAFQAGDYTIRIWNTYSYSPVSTLKLLDTGPPYTQHNINFSLDGSRLVSLVNFYEPQRSSRTTVWEVMTEEHLASITVDGWFKEVAFGVDGTDVILKTDDSEKIWRISPAINYKPPALAPVTSNDYSLNDMPSTDDKYPTDDYSSSDEDLAMTISTLSAHDKPLMTTNWSPTDDDSPIDGGSPSEAIDVNLPMISIPVHDTQKSVASPDVPQLRHYHYQRGKEWILDERNRRVFWILSDWRRWSIDHINEKKVVLGCSSGKLTIVDFSDVRY